MKLDGSIETITDNIQILNYVEMFSPDDAEKVLSLTDYSPHVSQLIAFSLGYMTAKHDFRRNGVFADCRRRKEHE